jgi:hypothetical protein
MLPMNGQTEGPGGSFFRLLAAWINRATTHIPPTSATVFARRLSMTTHARRGTDLESSRGLSNVEDRRPVVRSSLYKTRTTRRHECLGELRVIMVSAMRAPREDMAISQGHERAFIRVSYCRSRPVRVSDSCHTVALCNRERVTAACILTDTTPLCSPP